MTEKHEVISLIEQIEEVMKETQYEARAFPGHGIEFKIRLLEATRYLESVLVELNKAKDMLPDIPE